MLLYVSIFVCIHNVFVCVVLHNIRLFWFVSGCRCILQAIMPCVHKGNIHKSQQNASKLDVFLLNCTATTQDCLVIKLWEIVECLFPCTGTFTHDTVSKGDGCVYNISPSRIDRQS